MRLSVNPFIYLFLFVCCQCNKHKIESSGIGIGIMDYTRHGVPEKMLFYDRPNGRLVHEIAFRDTGSINYWGRQSWFIPNGDFVEDEYGGLTYLNYTCLESNPPWYKIILYDEKPYPSYWIKDTSTGIFMLWPDFMASLFEIDIKANVPIFVKPDTNSAKINFNGLRQFEPLEVRGYWVKTAYSSNYIDSSCSLCSGDRVPLGWIKWRTKDDLLVTYYETP